LFTAATLPASAAGDDWYTRGRNNQHTSHVEDPFQYLGPRYAFAVDTGLSGSQALNVDGVIYHMGGDSVWMIDPLVAETPEDARVT